MTIRNFGAIQKLKAQPQGLQLGLGTGGNTVVGDVLAGKTFTNDSGEQTGIMANNGAVTITPSSNNQTIPAGYHSGSGIVNAVPTNYKRYATGTVSCPVKSTQTIVSGLPFRPRIVKYSVSGELGFITESQVYITSLLQDLRGMSVYNTSNSPSLMHIRTSDANFHMNNDGFTFWNNYTGNYTYEAWE